MKFSQIIAFFAGAALAKPSMAPSCGVDKRATCPDTNTITDAVRSYIDDMNGLNGLFENNTMTIQEAISYEKDTTTQLNTLVSMCSSQFDSPDSFFGALAIASFIEAEVLFFLFEFETCDCDCWGWDCDSCDCSSQYLETINNYRCCTGMPALDKAFASAIEAVNGAGILDSITSPRPSTCEQAHCQNSCGSGVFDFACF